MPKAYSYLRFSTPEQSAGDSHRRQTALAEKYAAAQGLELDDKLTFHDLGVSAYQGKNVETGQLGAFLEAVRAGLVARGSYLLVESLDRISRQAARKALRALEAICDEGIVVITLADNREYTKENLDNDPLSLIMSLLVFIRANEESATKARRLRAAWDAKRANVEEKPLTARTPGWLTLDENTGQIKTISERAAIVRRIFRMALKGIGQHSIAEALNGERVPVFGRGRRWHRSYIAKLLSNAAVIGTLVPHKMEYVNGKKTRKPQGAIDGYYPPIVDNEDFQRVQSLRTGAAAPLRGRHVKAGVVRNVFGGLARCPQCGSTMTLVNKGAGRGGVYLACSTAKEGAGCRYHAVRYDHVEAALLRDAGWLLNTVPAGNGSDIDKKLDGTEAEILHVDEQIERVLDAIQGGKSSAALSQRLQTLEGHLEELRERHSDLLQQQADAAGPLVARKVADLKAALKAQPLARTEVNALLRQLLVGVTVNYNNGQLVFHWKHGGESEVNFAWPDKRKRRGPKKKTGVKR